jgi:hypothetical protein
MQPNKKRRMILSVATTAAALAAPACGGATDSSSDDAATVDAQDEQPVDDASKRDTPIIIGVVIQPDAGNDSRLPPILGLPPQPQDGGLG